MWAFVLRHGTISRINVNSHPDKTETWNIKLLLHTGKCKIYSFELKIITKHLSMFDGIFKISKTDIMNKPVKHLMKYVFSYSTKLFSKSTVKRRKKSSPGKGTCRQIRKQEEQSERHKNFLQSKTNPVCWVNFLVISPCLNSEDFQRI